MLCVVTLVTLWEGSGVVGACGARWWKQQQEGCGMLWSWDGLGEAGSPEEAPALSEKAF